MARCVICRRYYAPRRSRTLCDRHYWKVWRLRQKSPIELQQVVQETEETRACIEAALALDEDAQAAVAPAQRGNG